MQRTICSLYYKALEARRPYRRRDFEGDSGFNTIFRIPAAPRDGYQLLTIHDMEDSVQFSSDVPVTYLWKDTTGEKVAADLITEWRSNVANPDIGTPGIFICEDNDVKDSKGKVVKPATEPSARELALWRDSQTRYCEDVCIEATDLLNTGKRKLIKAHKHGEAAVWLGRSFDWQKAPEQTFTRDCPVCGAAVKAGVFKCSSCGEMFDPAGYDNWKKSMQRVTEQIKNAETQAQVQAQVGKRA